MTKDEIIKIAQEVGIDFDLIDDDEGQIWYITSEGLKAFATLVAATEREACAKVCDDIRHYNLSQETDDWIEGTKDCANAIRARGQ